MLYSDEPVGQVKVQMSKNIQQYFTPKHQIIEIYYPTAVVNKFINERGSVTVWHACTDLCGKQVLYCTNKANRFSTIQKSLYVFPVIWTVLIAVG